MGNKDPTPRADALRAQREARYGHLQATAEPTPNRHLSKNGRVLDGPPPKLARKLIPYAGKEYGGRNDLIGNGGAFRTNPKPLPTKPARKRVKRQRKIA